MATIDLGPLKQRARVGGVKVAPMNCDPAAGVDARCPECGYFHLRPGYCQAKNPVWTARIRAEGARKMAELRASMAKPALSVTESPDVTLTPSLSVTEPLSVTVPASLSVTCEECGEAFQSARSTARYCSPRCKVRSSRRRAGELVDG